MQESFVDAAPHLGCSKVHPQPLTDRQPLSPTAQLLGGRHEDGGQVTISRREGRAHPAPLHLPKPHHHSDWSPWLSGETQQLSCPCSATQTWLLSPHLPAEQAPTSTPDSFLNRNRTSTGKVPKAQEGQHSPGWPCLPRHRGRSQTTRVHGRVTCASTAGGPQQPQLTTGGFQQEQPKLALNWCPSTESSKLHPQPPQNFLPRTHVGKGRGVCTSSPFISGFLCCSGTVQTSPFWRQETQRGSH